MDRRYDAYRRLQPEMPKTDDTADREAQHLAQIMRDGVTGDMWLSLKSKIDGLILDAERRFVDTLAKDYETYVQWWSRRQALITMLSLQARMIQDEKGAVHAT